MYRPCTHWIESAHITHRRPPFFSLELSPGHCYRAGDWPLNPITFGASLAAGWLLYSSELKVSYREWPLETYYWPLSRWLDVFKELSHSNRIHSRWLYLLLSQESGKNKKTECLFLTQLISFSQDHQKVTCRWKTGSWWQGFKTDFKTRWLMFISFLPYQNSPRWDSK